MPVERRQFTTKLRAGKTGGFELELPFDPHAVWGEKGTHHIAGTVARIKVRGPLVQDGATFRLKLGPAWRRDNPLAPGEEVAVVMWAEGPQADALPDDMLAALEVQPAALAFWQGLATFYRKAYLTWLNGTSRRPALREERLRELVVLLRAGKKQRER